MKAIVYHSPREFEFMDVPDPEAAPDEVIIKVRACGVCQTDMHIHEGEFLAQFPLIPGHEIAGEITMLGSEVQGLQIGERVVADNTELCGKCFYCRRNQPLYCENFVSHGVNVAGGFAEYVSIKAKKVFQIKDLSWQEAIMVEPTACAIHGMDVIDLKPGSSVLIFGAGPTGMVLAQLIKLNGSVNLVVAAPAGPKLDLVGKLAADEIVPIDRGDYSQHRNQILSQYPLGFDYVVEATGVSALCEEALEYAGKGGQIIVYGVYPEGDTIQWNPYKIFEREITIKGSFAQTHCFGRALEYLESRKVSVKNFVTHEISLKQYSQAIDIMQKGEAIKILISP